MEPDKFRQIVQKYLVPLFSGAKLEDGFGDSTSRLTVAADGPCAFHIKPHKKETYCVIIKRSQVFAKKKNVFITERNVIESFIYVLNLMKKGIGEEIEEDLLSKITRRVVVNSIFMSQEKVSTVLSVIDQFDKWSNKLYEGQPIAAAIGFEPDNCAGGVSLDTLWKEEFSAVLTNGFDTILVSDFTGHIKKYESLTVPTSQPPFVPYRLSPIAAWTGKETERLSVVLNRTGEILVIRDKQLVFARRGGDWHFLTHQPVITQMKCPHNKEVRRAVYASCLDASFARTGACVGIMKKNEDKDNIDDVAPEKNDHIIDGTGTKAELIRNIIANNMKFQQLDRRLRLELLAIDGATILDHTGRILTVGAILRIDGGSTGGGRLAAATKLSRYGIGIKVSQDGGIKGFLKCDETKNPGGEAENPGGETKKIEPSFFVM